MAQNPITNLSDAELLEAIRCCGAETIMPLEGSPSYERLINVYLSQEFEKGASHGI